MSFDFLCSVATVGGAGFLVWCLWSLCWGVVPFTAKAQRRKETKAVLGAARTFILSYEDLPAYREGGEFGALPHMQERLCLPIRPIFSRHGI